MKCENCKYLEKLNPAFYSKYANKCQITNVLNSKECSLDSDECIPDMLICFNCKHWIGGGDWGLSCAKDYYITSSNGFDEVCEKFERKDD